MKGDYNQLAISSFLIYLLVAFLIIQLPFVGKYFSVTHTLIHEIGHGFAAILCGGRLKKIHLFSTTEGFAYTSHKGRLSQLITALSGYIGTSAFSYFSIWLMSIGKYQILLYFYVGLLIFTLILWVRNVYGFIWVLSAILLFTWLVLEAPDSWMKPILLLLTCIILIESIRSAYTIMFLSIKRPSEAGDATSLAQITRIIPTYIWGVLFFAQSLYFAWESLKIVHIG